MEHTVKVFERPEMENPVYKVVITDGAIYTYYIQRINNNDFDEWNCVEKDIIWEAKKFLGFTKKEAIADLIMTVEFLQKKK